MESHKIPWFQKASNHQPDINLIISLNISTKIESPFIDDSDPLVNVYITIENGPVEIVDLPINSMVILHLRASWVSWVPRRPGRCPSPGGEKRRLFGGKKKSHPKIEKFGKVTVVIGFYTCLSFWSCYYTTWCKSLSRQSKQSQTRWDFERGVIDGTPRIPLGRSWDRFFFEGYMF